jgi:hypothetical protein
MNLTGAIAINLPWPWKMMQQYNIRRHHMFFTKADIKIEVRLITDDAEKELILVLTELLWKLQERAEVPFLGWDNPEHTTPITFKDSFPIKLKDL